MAFSETNQSLRLFSPSAGKEYLTDEKYYMYADVVIFDQSDNYLGQIEVLFKKIGLSYEQEKMKQFYKSSEPKVVNSKPLDRHLLRARIIDVYEQLLARCLN